MCDVMCSVRSTSKVCTGRPGNRVPPLVVDPVDYTSRRGHPGCLRLPDDPPTAVVSLGQVRRSPASPAAPAPARARIAAATAISSTRGDPATRQRLVHPPLVVAQPVERCRRARLLGRHLADAPDQLDDVVGAGDDFGARAQQRMTSGRRRRRHRARAPRRRPCPAPAPRRRCWLRRCANRPRPPPPPRRTPPPSGCGSGTGVGPAAPPADIR